MRRAGPRTPAPGRRTARRAAARAIARAASAWTASAATAPAPRRARPATRTNAPGICSFVANGGQEDSSACAATAASTCGLDGTCDGQGRCRKHPAGTDLQARHLRRRLRQRRRRVRRRGPMQGRPRDDLRAVQLRFGDAQVRDDVHLEHRLRRRHPVRQRQLRAQAERRRLREGQRVQVGVLHRRPLLQRRLQGRVHQLQPARPRRDLLAHRRRRRRSARRLSGRRRPRPAG